MADHGALNSDPNGAITIGMAVSKYQTIVENSRYTRIQELYLESGTRNEAIPEHNIFKETKLLLTKLRILL